LIGVGYTTAQDVGFKATDLITALGPEIDQMIARDGLQIFPKVHTKITDLRSFVETFLFHFAHGQNGEYVS
jgi:hypothetical protein